MVQFAEVQYWPDERKARVVDEEESLGLNQSSNRDVVKTVAQSMVLQGVNAPTGVGDLEEIQLTPVGRLR